LDRFEDCLKKGRLKPAESTPELLGDAIRGALAELDRGRSRHASGAWDDALTQGFFAAYRAAQAALRARGYRDTNMYGLCAGLQHLFVEPGLLSAESVDQLREAKDQKDLVYEDGLRATPQEAHDMVLWAAIFIRRVLEILAIPEFDPGKVEVSLPPPRQRRSPPAGSGGRFGR
jgi:uncharacterized protein (UPF0332 family)